MESTLRPVTAPSADARSLRAAGLTALVWSLAALPFLTGIISCPTAQYLHRPCPGCGMTRALLLLVSGELGRSFSMHVFALPTLLSQLVFAIATVIAAYRWGAPWTVWNARWGRFAIGFVAL